MYDVKDIIKISMKKVFKRCIKIKLVTSGK